MLICYTNIVSTLALKNHAYSVFASPLSSDDPDLSDTSIGARKEDDLPDDGKLVRMRKLAPFARLDERQLDKRSCKKEYDKCSKDRECCGNMTCNWLCSWSLPWGYHCCCQGYNCVKNWVLYRR